MGMERTFKTSGCVFRALSKNVNSVGLEKRRIRACSIAVDRKSDRICYQPWHCWPVKETLQLCLVVLSTAIRTSRI